MQVTSVRTTVVGTPWRDLVFVELETDTGLVGVGEVRPLNKTDSFVATVEELAGRYVVGTDPFDTERLAWAIERLEYGRPSEQASRPSPPSTSPRGTSSASRSACRSGSSSAGGSGTGCRPTPTAGTRRTSNRTGSRSWRPRSWRAATGR